MGLRGNKLVRYRPYSNEWHWFVPCTPWFTMRARAFWLFGERAYEFFVRRLEYRFAHIAYEDALWPYDYFSNTGKALAVPLFAALEWSRLTFATRDALCHGLGSGQEAKSRLLAQFADPKSCLRPWMREGVPDIRWFDPEIYAGQVENVGNWLCPIYQIHAVSPEEVGRLQDKVAGHMTRLLGAWAASPYRGRAGATPRPPMVVGDRSMLGHDGSYADFSPLYRGEPLTF